MSASVCTQEIERKNETIELMDWVLIIGLILAPFTALRVYKFGPGEVLLIIWMLLALFKYSGCLFYTMLNVYQFASIAMMLIGGIIALVLYHESLSLTEILSHVFMLVFSVTLYNFYIRTTITKIDKIIKRVCICGLVVYAFLLVWGLYVSEYFLGHKMWMSGKSRFLALALNPHQIGMITGAMVFFSIYLCSKSKNMCKRVLYAGFAILWYIVGTYTDSSSMDISYLGSVCVVAIIILSSLGNNEKKRRDFLIVTIVAILCVCVLLSPFLMGEFLEWVGEDANGDERLALVSNAFTVLKNKPTGLFIGLGPGSHTGLYMPSGNEMEFHNTYVQIMMNSGVPILIFYIIATLDLIRRPQEKNPLLVGVVVFFLLYGFGGNMSRRVWVWFTYITVLALTSMSNKKGT